MRKLFNAIGFGVSGLAIVGSAMTVTYMIENEEDPFDDQLTPISRIIYNLKKDYSDINVKYREELENQVKSGKASQIDIAVMSSLKQSEKNIKNAHIDAINAEIRSRKIDAMTAPPITFRHQAPQKDVIDFEQMDILARIDRMESEFDITEREASSLKDAWSAAEKTGKSKNGFQEEAKKILSANKEVRDQAGVEELAYKMTR